LDQFGRGASNFDPFAKCFPYCSYGFSVECIADSGILSFAKRSQLVIATAYDSHWLPSIINCFTLQLSCKTAELSALGYRPASVFPAVSTEQLLTTFAAKEAFFLHPPSN